MHTVPGSTRASHVSPGALARRLCLPLYHRRGRRWQQPGRLWSPGAADTAGVAKAEEKCSGAVLGAGCF
jgi:hypothetical protein